jgi:hypothetical protein
MLMFIFYENKQRLAIDVHVIRFINIMSDDLNMLKAVQYTVPFYH